MHAARSDGQSISPPPPSAVAMMPVCASIAAWKSPSSSGASSQITPAAVAFASCFCHALASFVPAMVRLVEGLLAKGAAYKG